MTRAVQGAVQAMVFDLGETLVDETRHWSMVAHYAGIPELTLAGVLGGLIERRESHRSLFGYLNIESVDPNVVGYRIEARDLYPDVVPVLRQLQSAGYRIGICGNQPAGATAQVEALQLPADFVTSSSDMGVTKPDPGFFLRVAEHLELEPGEIVYVGDRLDNDVLPAQNLGFHAVFIRRGPWGFLHAGWPEVESVRYRIDDLAGIHKVIEDINASHRSTNGATQGNRTEQDRP